MAKSNFPYDIREFLTRDVQQQESLPLKGVSLNNIRYVPGIELAMQDITSFNIFEAFASAVSCY
jgi:hypothetical protein